MEQVTTLNGYDLFEVVSAFQKEIRRGNEEDAMYWGVELYESGFIPYAWKRMFIISTEDIGLANPMATVIINSLYWQYEKLSSNKGDKKKQERLPYVQAILYLVNSPKSRHTDWALNYYFDSHLFIDRKMKPIPDYALDIHTRRGKIKGKTIDDFFTEGSLVGNHQVQPNEIDYRNACRTRWNDKGWLDAAKQKKAEIETLKSFKYKTYQPEKSKPEQATQSTLFD